MVKKISEKDVIRALKEENERLRVEMEKIKKTEEPKITKEVKTAKVKDFEKKRDEHFTKCNEIMDLLLTKESKIFLWIVQQSLAKNKERAIYCANQIGIAKIERAKVVNQLNIEKEKWKKNKK